MYKDQMIQDQIIGIAKIIHIIMLKVPFYLLCSLYIQKYSLGGWGSGSDNIFFQLKGGQHQAASDTHLRQVEVRTPSGYVHGIITGVQSNQSIHLSRIKMKYAN